MREKRYMFSCSGTYFFSRFEVIKLVVYSDYTGSLVPLNSDYSPFCSIFCHSYPRFFSRITDFVVLNSCHFYLLVRKVTDTVLA